MSPHRQQQVTAGMLEVVKEEVLEVIGDEPFALHS